MKTLFLLLFALLFSPQVHATDVSPPIDTISLSSASAVTSVKLAAGAQYAVQCDGEIRYLACIDSTGCAATSTSAKITNFDLPVDICLQDSEQYLSLIRTGSSTVTCYIYRVLPKQCR